jgi:hypothetical protein
MQCYYEKQYNGLCLKRNCELTHYTHKEDGIESYRFGFPVCKFGICDCPMFYNAIHRATYIHPPKN